MRMRAVRTTGARSDTDLACYLMYFRWHMIRLNDLIGASLSEPHIDELHVRNLYIMIYVWYVRHPRAAIYNVQPIRVLGFLGQVLTLRQTECICFADSAMIMHVVPESAEVSSCGLRNILSRP